MSCCSKDDRLWWGLVAFVVGAVVLLERFGIVPTETWSYLWPSILIVSGLKWMLSGSSTNTCEMEGQGCDDCGDMNCSCDTMPMPSKLLASSKAPAKKSKRK